MSVSVYKLIKTPSYNITVDSNIDMIQTGQELNTYMQAIARSLTSWSISAAFKRFTVQA